MYAITRRRAPAARFVALAAALCLAFALSACQTTKGEGKKAAAPANPNEKQLAYGVSITLPPSWKVADSKGPEVSKASIDATRAKGDRTLIIETLGSPSARGLESLIVASVVTQQNTFMPREYAEKFQPNEFALLAKDLLKLEKDQAKKAKQPSNALDLQISRENIGGLLAICHKTLMAAPDGKPVLLINWDIYLPNDAGIAVRTVCDPEAAGAEAEVAGIVRTIRVQP